MIKVGRAGLFCILIVLMGRYAVMSAPQDASTLRLKSLIPKKALGWRAEAKDEIYDPQTIFDYIDGAGEVYRAYNFRQLLSRRFKKAGKPDIVVDLFDMGSPEDAFGVFTHDLEGEDPGIGQGGTYDGGLLSFWKGRYFVSIYAEGETAETKEALFALGRSIAPAIEQTGAKPPLLGLLPAEFAAEKAVRYFHNYIILNRHFFVSQENILNLDQSTEGVLSKPGTKSEKGVLLLIKYPGPIKAEEAYKSFMKVYMPEAKESGIVQTEDKKWTVAMVRKDLIAIVFGALSAESGKNILAKVENKIK